MSEYIVDFGNSMAMLSRIIESPSAWLCGEIVRCRDCAYCMAYMAGTYCDYMAHAIEPNGFCAWAKRKECGDD